MTGSGFSQICPIGLGIILLFDCKYLKERLSYKPFTEAQFTKLAFKKDQTALKFLKLQNNFCLLFKPTRKLSLLILRYKEKLLFSVGF